MQHHNYLLHLSRATYGNVIISGGGTKTLSGDATIGSQLFLVNGLFELNTNNLCSIAPHYQQYRCILPLPYIVTNGTGTLQQNIRMQALMCFLLVQPALGRSFYQFCCTSFIIKPFSSRFISGFGGDNGLPLAETGDNLTHTSVGGYWNISSSTPVADLYTATFRAKAFSDIIDYTKLHLLKRTNVASPWTLNGTHVTTTGSMHLLFYSVLVCRAFQILR